MTAAPLSNSESWSSAAACGKKTRVRSDILFDRMILLVSGSDKGCDGALSTAT